MSMNPQPKGFSLLLHRLNLGRVRTKCLRLSLLQELPVLLKVLRKMCDQPAGCGSAVHVEGISKAMLFWSLVNEHLKCQQIILSSYLFRVGVWLHWVPMFYSQWVLRGVEAE